VTDSPTPSIGPELSSVRTQLTELTGRVGGLAAESLSGSSRDDVATALFEIERSLTTAGRRLEQLVTDLR
jgi:hypothetical protein